MEHSHNHHRLTQAQKDANDKQYYKQQVDLHDRFTSYSHYGMGFGNMSEYTRMRINYDLINNKIDPRDFTYVTNPWGDEVGELPANLTNRDITSPKIKAILGIEMKRPFNWKVIAVNPSATTRKEQEEFGRLKQFVISSIMTPIEQQIAAEFLKEANQNVTDEELKALQQEIANKLKAQTPAEIKKYMLREHQDPAEILGSQLLTYLTQKLELPALFNKGCKHAAVSGREIYYVGISNGEPSVSTVNSVFFDFDKSPDLDFIEDGQWATAEYRLTPSDVITEYMDDIIEMYGRKRADEIVDDLFESGGRVGVSTLDMDDIFFDDTRSSKLVRVVHCVWKSLRKIGFLKFYDGNEIQERIVNENYEFNEEAGDIEIRWEWISEVHEGTKIGASYFVRLRPVPNQFKDLDNLYECKLPYMGAVYDAENSESTSLVDRIRPYQYLYNIIWYRAELLMAQDKGKKVLFDIGAIPRSNGITLKKHEYYLDANSYGYLNPREEGNRGALEITNLVKEIDLSNTGDISKYVELAQYVDARAGEAVGVTKQLEGQIAEREAVSNVNKAITLSTNILEDFFQKHDQVKKRVLQALLECAKVAYTVGKPKKLSYVLDDMSVAMLSIDQELLDNSTYGIFVTDARQAYENKEMLITLGQAALQNQMIGMSSLVKMMQSTSVQEAEEILLYGEEQKREELMAAQQAQAEQAAQMERLRVQHEREKWQHEKEMIELTEKLKYKRELAKQAILAMGFAPDTDISGDNVPDVVNLLDKLLENKKLNIDKYKAESDVQLKKEEIDIKRKEAQKPNKTSK